MILLTSSTLSQWGLAPVLSLLLGMLFLMIRTTATWDDESGDDADMRVFFVINFILPTCILMGTSYACARLGII